MRSEITNGQVVVINETFAESFEAFNDMLTELGQPVISEKVAKSDFGIMGGETNAELQEWANDYASEVHTEAAADKQAWRYQY